MTATLDRAPSGPAPAPAPPTRVATPPAAAEVAIAGLTLASVGALSRLFTAPVRFLVPVMVVAIAVHLTAWLGRRRGLGLPAAAAACAVVAAVLTSWLVLGASTLFGLPGAGTARAAGDALSNAAAVYRTTAAPAPVLPGFTLAGALGAAAAAFLADWAAFRMAATTEACLPSFSLFVLSAALAQGHHALLAGVLWLTAVLAFLLVRQGALDHRSSAWFASRSPRGPGRVLVAGGLLAGVVIAIVALVGPLMPGAGTRAVIDWRNTRATNSGRNTGSPLVDIKARLHDQSQLEVFTVATTRPAYWRLTSLDTFDGSGWSLNDTYQRASNRGLPGAAGPLAEAGPSSPAQSTFHVGSLGSIWLPAAYRPAQVTGARGLSYSPDAGSLITDHANSDGQNYTVVSDIPGATTAALESSPAVPATTPAVGRYLQLPAGIPREVRVIALEVTQGANSPYEAARRLQDWLRGPDFRYDLNVPANDSQNALVDFLTRTRAGFCQQFAGAFAVLARELGLPARVAVGFTAGTQAADGSWHVRDSDAHAWPEVYFANVGWIAFEPTPGRASPDAAAQAITGVAPSTPQTVPGATATTTPVTQPSGAATPQPTTTVPAGGSPATTPRHRNGLRVPGTGLTLTWSLLAAVAALLAGPLLWAGVLSLGTTAALGLRRRRARTATDRVALSWIEARESLVRGGLGERPADTPAETARRAGEGPLEPAGAAAVGDLARLVEATQYGPDGAGAEAVAAADRAVQTLERTIRQAAAPTDRLRWALDPRPLVRVARGLLGRQHTPGEGPPVSRRA